MKKRFICLKKNLTEIQQGLYIGYLKIKLKHHHFLPHDRPRYH